MSWDAYVSNNLMCPVDGEGNTLVSAALLGQDGGVWAKSADFPDASTDEVLKLASTFGLDRTDPKFPPSLVLGGIKFITQLVEDKAVLGRGTGDNGSLGFVAAKSNTAIVIGIYKEPTTKAPLCRKIVESLQEYLESTGY